MREGGFIFGPPKKLGKTARHTTVGRGLPNRATATQKNGLIQKKVDDLTTGQCRGNTNGERLGGFAFGRTTRQTGCGREMLSSSIWRCRAFVTRSHPSTRFISPFSSSLVNPCFVTNSGWGFVPWKSNPARRMSASATKAVSPAQPLKDAEVLINSVETFIFDCDGVIWKGDKLIDGVPGTLDMLRSKGKRLVFVTNNSTKSRKQYGKKFETLGLDVSEEEIFASSFAAAAYLTSINFPKNKKVYVIGEDGILKELELAGYQYLGGPEDCGKKIELKPGFLMEHDKDVGAVVVGFDRYFNYYKVQYGTLCVRENPGCLFVATNRDAVTHLTDAQEWAGGGSMVGALCGSTQQEPLVVGKPSTFMMDYLANKFGILKSQICMVGDRLDTDILFGQNGGCKTLLVLSGVTTLSMLQNPKNPIQPDFYTDKISDFLSLKTAAL